jgi:hypothetical protein
MEGWPLGPCRPDHRSSRTTAVCSSAGCSSLQTAFRCLEPPWLPAWSHHALSGRPACASRNHAVLLSCRPTVQQTAHDVQLAQPHQHPERCHGEFLPRSHPCKGSGFRTTCCSLTAGSGHRCKADIGSLLSFGFRRGEADQNGFRPNAARNRFLMKGPSLGGNMRGGSLASMNT